MLAVVLVATSAALFPPLAPPRPDELLSKVAELVLRARLRESQEIQVTVKDGGGMLLGSVDGVSVRGRGWCTPQRLSCRSLEMQVGKTSIDFSALASQRRIVMQKPSIGSADITFTAKDWDNFLNHPLFAAAVADRRSSTTAPSVKFARTGTRLLADGVTFPLQWAGEIFRAKLSQQPEGKAIVSAVNRAGENNAEAGDWIAALFNELVLDLDGCALTFRQLGIAPAGAGGDSVLSLALDVRVRSFPSLDVNF